MKTTNEPKIDSAFAFHKLNQAGQTRAQKIAELFHNLSVELHLTIFEGEDSTTSNWEGREWSITRTKLEEACFFAKKTMAQRIGNQEGAQ